MVIRAGIVGGCRIVTPLTWGDYLKFGLLRGFRMEVSGSAGWGVVQGMGHEQDEFGDFYRASRDSCLRAVTAVVGDRELAGEQVAEAFTRAWTSWGKARRHAAPRAWVVRTALNLGVSRWRRRHREVPLADHDGRATGRLRSRRLPDHPGRAPFR